MAEAEDIELINQQCIEANKALESKIAAIAFLDKQKKELLEEIDKHNDEIIQLLDDKSQVNKTLTSQKNKLKESENLLIEQRKNLNEIELLVKTKNGEKEELSKQLDVELAQFADVRESVNQEKEAYKALEENLNSIIQTTESASLKEKELLGKTLELQKGLQLLRDEEEAQVLLTQEAKQKKEKVLGHIKDLEATKESIRAVIKQEEAKLKETDEALLLKGTELSTVIAEVNEKLQVLQIAEQKLEQKKKQLDKEILNAKAERLIK
jgi:chromosome segregation ATPase